MVDPTKMTVCEWQARQIEKAAGILANFVLSTREDRLRWCPSTEPESKARSVMDLLGECVEANHRARCYLREEDPGPRPAVFDLYGDAPETIKVLKASAAELAEEIRHIPSEELMRVVQTHRGPMPIALAIQLPLRNMIYHIGQINMIQLLYGDTEFHITEEFMTL
jgi:hypothetical protein